MSIGLFYSTSTGNTEAVSEDLKDKFEEIGVTLELHTLEDDTIETMKSYDKIILAGSTWGEGDLEDGWEDFFPKLKEVDFNGKKVAILALGDQEGYGETFVNSMRTMHDEAKKNGATMVGYTTDEGYEYEASESVENGKFLGLAIDEDNQDDLTPDRIDAWANQLKTEFSL